MNLSSETNRSTRGITRANPDHPAAKRRLAGLGFTVLIGTLLMIWASRTTWERLDRLQHEFSTLRADSFYLGVRMQSEIRRLNDTLLRYRLKADTTDYENFRADAEKLRHWFETSRTNAATPLEKHFFEEVGAAYTSYINDSLMLLVTSIERSEKQQARDFPKSYEKVQAQSQHMLDLCESFITTQRAAFDGFLRESQNTLTVFTRLLQLSLGLLLILAIALVILVYRGMIAPLQDQLTESQAVIVRQEKLASLGVLAAGVAHEIRNPLTAIKFRLFSLKKSLADGGEANEDAVVIGNEISRLERIVKDFLKFARPSEPQLIVTPAQRLLLEVYELLQPQMKKLEIELALQDGDALWVRADNEQIKQVLINLVQNSAESIGRNGRIILRARPERTGGRRGEACVALEVVDNGRGIPHEIRERLFDPFFTTKEGGTGLGLPIAARIVEKHGGELRHQTHLDRGAIFSVILPRVEDET